MDDIPTRGVDREGGDIIDPRSTEEQRADLDSALPDSFASALTGGSDNTPGDAPYDAPEGAQGGNDDNFDAWGQGSEVHHYHHQHCPNSDCSSTPAPASSGRLGAEIRRMRRTISQVVESQERLTRACETVLDTTVSTLSLLQAIGPCRCHRRGRVLGQTAQGLRTPESPPQRRGGWSEWFEVDTLSPVRQRTRSRASSPPPGLREAASGPPPSVNPPQAHARSQLGREPPRRSSTPLPLPRDSSPPSREPTPPPPERRSVRLSPTSPSSLGRHLRATHPQVSDTHRRNTRDYLFGHLVRVRELNPTISSDGGWDRFVSRVNRAGVYETEEDIKRAWQLAFEQPVHGHFRSLWLRRFEDLRSALPETWSIRPSNLIRF